MRRHDPRAAVVPWLRQIGGADLPGLFFVKISRLDRGLPVRTFVKLVQKRGLAVRGPSAAI